MNFYFLGSRHASEKFAFGPEEANRVLALAKARQLPKASARAVPVLSATPSPKEYAATNKATYKKLIGPLGPGIGEFLKDQTIKGMNESSTGSIMQQIGKPVIYPGQGYVEKTLTAHPTNPSDPYPKIPAAQKKMLHAVLKGHELDESSVRGRMGAGMFGHRSPDVIFREHNRLVTLPKGNEAVQALMKRVRSPVLSPEVREMFEEHNLPIPQRTGEGFLFPERLTYGEGARLSRHARKRLTELAEEKQLKSLVANKDTLQEMAQQPE